MDRAIPRRIHIIGSIGSGKTTLAKTLSNHLNIPYYELDNVVWKRFDTGDIRRTEQERDEYLSSIINSEYWIIEGVHHKWVSPCFQNADLILFLDTNFSTRRIRIIKRYFKQKIGIEKVNYRPTLKILKDLYRYNTVFEYKSKPEIFDMLTAYEKKFIILKSNDEIKNYIN
ncbi:AAA family ATPase [Halalkalibacter okhensis]|uniref:DNA topology modulation protein FlaR n=1 Tax=Halalkalibacter okhensis TaxID=333138 RepID=A0A0B0I6A2_9BACI|nr:AAA family ATPase [Halalkalibacter okhensis]KHF37983.1 DNA topology modulation protein FlaR [Halalkalibacter okhensis]